MKTPSLTPLYYYPTTVLLVDDSKHFLEGISFKLDDQLIYQLYDKPYQLLQYLKEDYLEQITLGLNAEQPLNFATVIDQLHNPKRYREVGVVMVDYSMPSMNGLEFCQQIQNLPIKKILVTGEADSEIAIKAFNEGIIDKFIHKSDYDFGKKINAYISELQLNYFQNLSNSQQHADTITNNPWLTDSLFLGFFKHTCKELQITEYYYLAESDMFILIDRDNKITILLVGNKQDIKLSNNQNYLVLKNWESIAKHFPELSQNDNLYPATQLKGIQTYYHTFIPDLTINFIDANKIISFRQYLGL